MTTTDEGIRATLYALSIDPNGPGAEAEVRRLFPEEADDYLRRRRQEMGGADASCS